MEEDVFLTFIAPKEIESGPLDIQKMMLRVVQNYNISVSEFWQMPLQTVLELFGIFQPPEKKPISRKKLIDQERRFNGYR